MQVCAALLDEEAPQAARPGVRAADLARARDERLLRLGWGWGWGWGWGYEFGGG